MESGVGVLELRRGGEVAHQIVPDPQPSDWVAIARSVLEHRGKPLRAIAVLATPIKWMHLPPGVYRFTEVHAYNFSVLLDSKWGVLLGSESKRDENLERYYKPVDVSRLEWLEWCTIDLDSNTLVLRRRTGSGEAVIYSGSIDGFLTQEGNIV